MDDRFGYRLCVQSVYGVACSLTRITRVVNGSRETMQNSLLYFATSHNVVDVRRKSVPTLADWKNDQRKIRNPLCLWVTDFLLGWMKINPYLYEVSGVSSGITRYMPPFPSSSSSSSNINKNRHLGPWLSSLPLFTSQKQPSPRHIYFRYKPQRSYLHICASRNKGNVSIRAPILMLCSANATYTNFRLNELRRKKIYENWNNDSSGIPHHNQRC